MGLYRYHRIDDYVPVTMDQHPSTSQLPSITPTPTAAPRAGWIMMVIILCTGILLGIVGTHIYQRYTTQPAVSSYEECTTSRGSIIQESYPATCITRDGKRFIQPIDGSDTNPIYTDPTSCTTDADCTIGIQSDGCCMCPKAINVRQVGNDGWTKYGSTQKPSEKTRTCETFAACAPCESPTSPPVCRNNQCTFNADTFSTPQPGSEYICPATEWVDCMPGPDSAGIKFECTDTFLSWAQENCPNFKGAAL